MSELFEVIILGLVQGIVDPMPVSSSGHLVLIQHFFGLQQRITLSVFLHFGNLLAIILVFRKDIKEIFTFNPKYPKLTLYIIIGIIPAGLVGFFAKDFFNRIFDTTLVVGIMLIVTGLVLFISRWIFSQGRNMEDMNLKDALIVGGAQALAIFPGLSRSGMTIVGGLFSGLERQLAVKYSFLMSIPIVFGATLLEAIEVLEYGTGGITFSQIAAGTISAVISGFAAIKLLQHIVDRQKLSNFAYYCWILGALVIRFLV